MRKVLSIAVFASILPAFLFAEDLTYKKYQPADPSPKPQEGIDWSRFSMYDAQDKSLPRVLMIGDSICNANHRSVRELLKGKYSVAFWASSMDATDPDFIYALNLILEQAPYDIITFNNGLHGHRPLPERVVAIENAVKFIREKLPDSKLIIVGTTPVKTQSSQPDKTLPNLAAKMNLPFVDLNAIMAPLDREKYWSDKYHFKKEAVDMQGKAIAEAIEREGAKLGGARVRAKTFSPTPVISEDTVFSNIVGLNTKSKVGKRVFLTGRFSHGAAWHLREKAGKHVNISAWETSKCITDPDFARMFMYAMTLLPYDYVMFIQPEPVHADGKKWTKAFVQMMNFLRAKYPNVKVVLCSAPAGTIGSQTRARFLEEYAAKNRMEFFSMFDSDQKDPANFIGDALVKLLKLSKDEKGNIVPAGSDMGPSGAVK